MKNSLTSSLYRYWHNASFWSLADQAVVSGGNFALGLWLAYWLGLADFGQFSLWYLSTLFVLGIHQAFIGQAFQGLWSQKSADERPAYSRGLWMVQTLAVLGLGLVWVALRGIGAAGAYEMVLAAALLGLLLGWHDFLRKYCFAIQRYRLPWLMDLLLFGGLAVGLIVLARQGHQEASDVLWLYAFIYGAVGLAFAGYLRLFAPSGGARVWWTTLKAHYHFSFWLLGAALLQWLAGNSFLLAAAACLGPAALGGLRVAQQLVGLSHILFQSLENTMPVAASQYFHEQGATAMWRYLRQVSLRAAWPLGSLLLVLSVGAPVLSHWFLGPEAAGYAWLVAAYSGLYVWVFLAIPTRIALRTIGQSQAIFVAYTVNAVVGLSLAYPLARHSGALGIMMGLYLSQILSLGIYFFVLTVYVRKNELKSQPKCALNQITK